MGNELHLIYNEIVNRFLKVSFSKFRRDFLKHLKVEKSETKNIQTQKKQAIITLNDIQNDKSSGRVVTHLKLKTGFLQNEDYLNNSKCTNKFISIICTAYGLTVNANTKN